PRLGTAQANHDLAVEARRIARPGIAAAVRPTVGAETQALANATAGMILRNHHARRPVAQGGAGAPQTALRRHRRVTALEIEQATADRAVMADRGDADHPGRIARRRDRTAGRTFVAG